jgi:hypothetical protein
MGIVDWRIAELKRLGAELHANAYMEAQDIGPLNPDVVILATGGLPQIDLGHGDDLCLNTWDVLTGQASLAGDVLVYDGTGRHPGPLAAERIVDKGANVRYVSIDAQLAEELTYAERWRWKSLFLERGIQPIMETRLVGVERRDNRLLATLVNEISRHESHVLVDHVVVEQGSVPKDEIYMQMRGWSANCGVSDLDALVKAAPQPRLREEGFELHRIGDAVSSRNIHAAMLDALRLCSAL